ncbi:MAG: PKD domain-containing protein [Candidatus Thermoplasmatota archaeon]|jgi:PKD repeat protein|nr:PKD domain-containing protein [Candidatus Thermoplasmatota archaeon]
MLRLSQIVIFTCIVLLFSTIPFDSLLREEETVAEADVIDPENIGKSGSILTVGSGGPDKKVIMTTRSASPDDIEELKARAGVWQPGVDYNPIINGRGTGLKPPTEEEWAGMVGDFGIVEGIAPPINGPISASVDHFSSNYFPPIGNQANEGSCVAWATAYYTKTFQEAKEHGWDLSGASFGGGEPTEAYHDRIMSPDFMYHQINDGLDTGSYYNSAMDLCNRIGISSWKNMPYDPNDSTTWPTEAAWREAPWYRTDQGYNYLWTYPPNNANGITDLKTWLDNENLAIISLRAEEYANLDANDLWKNDTYSDAAGTNHANTIIGYDDNFGPYTENGQARTGAFKVANQWGTGWGGDSNNDGMYWLSYECMKWDIEYTFLFDDKIAYEPKVLSVFEMSHNKRGECDVSVGIGDPDSPVSVKDFDDWYNGFDGGNEPFPNNKMVFDITEFMDDVPEINGSTIFIKVNDTASATTGSIDSFSVEYYSDYLNDTLFIKALSGDPGVNTDPNNPVNASLTLEDITNPVADAGTDQTVGNGTTVYFNGTGSSDNSAVDNYTWNFSYKQAQQAPQGGKLGFILNGNGKYNVTLYGDKPNFTFNSYDEYNVTLNVTDPSGNWNLDHVIINVKDMAAPGADAGPDQIVDQGDTVTFDGSGSSDDVGIDNYTWNFSYDGQERTLYNVSPNFTFVIVGSYVVNLNVTDAEGNSDTDTMNVTVNDTTAPQFGAKWHNTLGPGDPAFFSANITDNVGINTVMFDFTLNGIVNHNWSVTNNTGNSWEINFTMPVDTTSIEYFFWAEDTSNNGGASNNESFGVNDSEAPAFGTIWKNTPTTGETAFFSGNITDNVGVNTVMFDFTLNGISHYNWSVTNNTGDSWTISIPLSGNAASIEYYFWAEDGSGNGANDTNASVVVGDNDKAAFGNIWSSGLSTGELALFSANITDNIGVNSVKFGYTVNGNINENVSVVNQTGDNWTITIRIPTDCANFKYFFWADDAAGNERRTGETSPAVTDNDRPVIGIIWNGGITTGDNALFSANITDNIGINSVKFGYTVNGNINENVTVANQSGDDWTITIRIPVDCVSFEFFFWVDDAVGNERKSVTQTPGVADNDRPVIGVIWNGGLSTGELTLFSANITDNIGVNSVKFGYTVNGNINENVSVTNQSGNDWTITIRIPADCTSFEYFFWSDDATGNEKKSTIRTPVVADNDRPAIGTIWNAVLSTGELVLFSANITENIGVNSVKFGYTVNGAINENVSVLNQTGDNWTIMIRIPADCVSFEYFFWVNDGAGNERRSATQTPAVSDNDLPVFGIIWASTLTTGDSAYISANITDNIVVDTVTLDFTINGAQRHNWSVTNKTGNSWDITILLPADTLFFEYKFHARDSSGNWEESQNATPSVSDNDKPMYGVQWESSLSTGEMACFSVNVSDNLAIGAVMFDFTINNVSNYNWTVTNVTGESWSIYIRIPGYATSIEYWFWSQDASGNRETSNKTVFAVTDNDGPVSDPGMNITTDQHIPVVFNGSNSTDNVGVDNYTWNFIYEGQATKLYGMSPVFIFHIVGTYTVTLNVSDASGQWDLNTTEVTVLDITPPTVEAGSDRTIDQHEILYFDSTGSGDNVGIGNYTWNFTCGGICVQLYGAYPIFTFNFAGNFSIELIILDRVGNQARDNMTVNVNDITLPVAEAGFDLVVNQHQEAILNGSASTDNTGIKNYTWEFMDNGTLKTLYGAVVGYVFHNAGTFNITLTARDATGNMISDYLNVTVNDTTPPKAMAGPNVTIVQHEYVTFDGRNSIDNVGIVNYTWSITPVISRVVLNGALVSYQFHTAGIFTVNLTTMDSRGNRAYDILVLTVTDIAKPVASAGPDITVDQHERVSFNGNASSDNVGITNYTWTFSYEGSDITLVGEKTSFVFHRAGVYEVTLTVSDALGNNETVDLTVTVLDITNPVADAGGELQSGDQDLVTFDASGSTDNVGIVAYNWTFIFNENTYVIKGKNVSFKFDIVGKYTVTLNVLDAMGNRDSDTMEVTIKDTTPPVVMISGPLEVGLGDLASFNGTLSRDNVGIASYLWSILHNGNFENSAGISMEYRFKEIGEYTITLTVTDSEGNSGTKVLIIIVADLEPPQADPGEDVDLTEPGLVIFDGAGSLDNGEIENYTWTFTYQGETIKLYGKSPSFSFDVPGNYKVVLDVTDAEGNHHEMAKYVNVSAPADKRGEADEGKWMQGAGFWIMLAVLVLIVLLVLFFLFGRRRKKESKKEKAPEEEEEIVMVSKVTSGPLGYGKTGTKRKGKVATGNSGAHTRGKEAKSKRGAGRRKGTGAVKKGKISAEARKGRSRGKKGRKTGKKGGGKRTGKRKRGRIASFPEESSEKRSEKIKPETVKSGDMWDEDEWAFKISRFGEEEGNLLEGREDEEPWGGDWHDDTEEEEAEEGTWQDDSEEEGTVEETWEDDSEEVEKDQWTDGFGEEDMAVHADWGEEAEHSGEEEEEDEYECPDCGFALGEDDNICPSCGAEFEEEEEVDEASYWPEEGIFEPPELEGGRYGDNDEEVDFIIDTGYVEFGADDVEYECPECRGAIGQWDTDCQECGTTFDDEDEEGEVAGASWDDDMESWD